MLGVAVVIDKMRGKGQTKAVAEGMERTDRTITQDT